MQKKTLLFFFFLPMFLVAQEHTFVLKGENCLYNEKLLIVEQVFFSDSVYSALCKINRVEKNKPLNMLYPKNCKFSFDGEASIPVPITITFIDESNENEYESDIFFIESGINSIYFGNLSENKEVININNANKELAEIKKILGFNSFNFMNPKDVERSLELLKPYIKKYPNSYAAMWLMIIMTERSKDFGQLLSSSILLENCKLFSEEIHKNTIFQYFYTKLIRFEKLNQPNSTLPFEDLILGSDMKEMIYQNQYTLIDFWASSCAPCIKQLPDLKNLYEKKHSQGFDIFAISEDRNDVERKRATAIFEKYNVPWENHFDYGKKDFNSLVMYRLPSNLLVDKNGKILMKDITMDNLISFLMKNLD